PQPPGAYPLEMERCSMHNVPDTIDRSADWWHEYRRRVENIRSEIKEVLTYDMQEQRAYLCRAILTALGKAHKWWWYIVRKYGYDMREGCWISLAWVEAITDDGKKEIAEKYDVWFSFRAMAFSVAAALKDTEQSGAETLYEVWRTYYSCNALGMVLVKQQ